MAWNKFIALFVILLYGADMVRFWVTGDPPYSSPGDRWAFFPAFSVVASYGMWKLWNK